MSGDYANQWLKAAQEARELEARCAQLEAERNEYAERLQWLRDLREREGSWGKPYERAMAASDSRGGEPYECEEERDRLAERCARLQQALDPETLARKFHETYERLAPKFGYETRRESAVPWEEVPEANRALMVAVAGEVAREALAGPDTLTAGEPGVGPDGTGRVATADGCAERQSTVDPSPAASEEPA